MIFIYIIEYIMEETNNTLFNGVMITLLIILLILILMIVFIVHTKHKQNKNIIPIEKSEINIDTCQNDRITTSINNKQVTINVIPCIKNIKGIWRHFDKNKITNFDVINQISNYVTIDVSNDVKNDFVVQINDTILNKINGKIIYGSYGYQFSMDLFPQFNKNQYEITNSFDVISKNGNKLSRIFETMVLVKYLQETISNSQIFFDNNRSLSDFYKRKDYPDNNQNNFRNWDISHKIHTIDDLIGKIFGIIYFDNYIFVLLDEFRGFIMVRG